MRILVLEDHPDTAQLLARVLTHAGYDVETAQTVAEARRACAGAAIDLLVADIVLGDGDGWELMEDLVSEHDQRGVSVSALPNHEAEARSREVGYTFHLTKPLEISALLRAVRATLAGSRNPPRDGQSNRVAAEPATTHRLKAPRRGEVR